MVSQRDTIQKAAWKYIMKQMVLRKTASQKSILVSPESVKALQSMSSFMELHGSSYILLAKAPSL